MNPASDIKKMVEAGAKAIFVNYRPGMGLIYSLQSEMPTAWRIELDYCLSVDTLCKFVAAHKDDIIIFDTGTFLHSSASIVHELSSVLVQVVGKHVHVEGVADFEFTGVAIITSWEVNKNIQARMDALKDRCHNVDSTVL